MMWILILLILLIGIYLFLIAPRMISKPERSVFMNVHYAHRGLFDNDSDSPENSMRAFQKAVEAGYGIEFDVQLSKDNIPVVFHDDSLKRMCGVEGKVWEYALQELQQLRLANSDQTISTLEQVLSLIAGKVPLIIEYKMDRVDTKVCELGNAILEKYDGVYCIESFHPFAVRWYREHRPDVMRGQLSQNYARTTYKGIQYWLMTNLLTNFLTRPDFIAYNCKHAPNLSRRICRIMGALSVAWTVKNRKQYIQVEKDFDLFIFDSFKL